MKHKRNLIASIRSVFFVLIAICLILTFSELATASDPIKLRFSTSSIPSQSNYYNQVMPFKNRVERETNGRVQVKIYGGSQLNTYKEAPDALRNNIVDVAVVVPPYHRGRLHLAYAADLPLAFPNPYVGARVMEELYTKYIKSEFKALGFMLGCYYMTPPYYFVSKKKPIRTLEDVKGLKVRSAGGVSSEVVKALGGVPVRMSIGEQYEAMQRGTVDATLTSLRAAVIQYKFAEVCNYITKLPLNHVGIVWGMNIKWWKSLPSDIRNIIYGIMREAKYWYIRDGDIDDEMLEKWAKIGTLKEVIKPSPEETTRWQNAVMPVWDTWVEKNESEGRPAKQMLADIEKLKKKYEKSLTFDIVQKAITDPVQGLSD